MHIKQIIIQGFKSYKDQMVIEPFSSKLNVIVGRNGSGKSNFFSAIRFVLSDDYTQLARDERAALLHEGSGSAVQTAFVEIIFDNSDERFPTGRDEVVLRRTIGLKKDEYSLDRKNATKADVMNLLESAGFSRSNPYYIVPQGRVTKLTNMKDGERLNLLKEVAGTQVYEARRSESLRIMGDTEAKRAKIDELMANIHERLSELEEEKEELREFQDKDKERRCLEYTIYQRENQEIDVQLENLDNQRAQGAEQVDMHRQQFLVGEEAISKIDEKIKSLQQRMELLKLDKNQYEDERRQATKERAKTELEIKAITDGQSAAQNARAQMEEELQEVRLSVRQRETQLGQVVPQYKQALDQESGVKVQLNEAEGTRHRLYAKQGRNAQFPNKKERDSWLKKDIGEVDAALAQRKAAIAEADSEITELRGSISTGEAELESIRNALGTREDTEKVIHSQIREAKEARDRLVDERKELWREQAKLDSVLKNAKERMEKADDSLSRLMDRDTARGIEAVRHIKKQRKLEGVYGTLAELFEVPERFKTAVEATAGSSLLHIVVDTDETASQVLEILQKERAGRVTFMPLNRLRPKSANIPKANDAIEMIEKLKFDKRYEKALQQVFGKTIICPNLQIAAQYARSHGVNAITPDGDRSDKKGALTGGYHDPKQSRLDAVANSSKWRREYEEQQSRAEHIKRDVGRLDQEVTRAMSELQKAEQKRVQLENGFEPMQQELRRTSLDLQSKRDRLEAKEKAKTNVEQTIAELMQQRRDSEAELASEFKKALSPDEERQLDQLNASIPDLKKHFLELSNRRAELEAQKSTAEAELRENLRPRLEQLQNQERESNQGGGSSNLKGLQKELQRVNKKISGVEAKLGTVDSHLDGATTELSDLDQTRTAQQREQEEVARAIEKSQKRSEKTLAKRSLLTAKATETQRAISSLGALPEEAFERKYASIPSEKALKRLHTLKETLKKYSHVNKKAFEQYQKVVSQREGLTKRRAELDTSQSAIQELIDTLDQRKDEAIERTFKQVSREFATIFERLVPAGRGRLIIQRKTDRQMTAEREDEDAASDADEGARARGSVENYTGVSIAVSFNSKHDEQQRLAQLSGGQKSLCALALVFAIQQCDPAPFYLFDEIDANLDAQYRTAVAGLLEEISQGKLRRPNAPAPRRGKGRRSRAAEEEEDGEGELGCQFICTTFRAEMVHVAEKCYGVSFARKSSSIDVVDHDEALGFVEGIVGGA